MAFPRFIGIKSSHNNKYLRYVHEDVQIHGFLEFSGEDVVCPYTKYEVEMSKTGNGRVHIRSCYNNKYWVRRSEGSSYIIAGADEPEEDASLWTCTLFEPAYVDDTKTTVRIRHVQRGFNVRLYNGAATTYGLVLWAAGAEQGSLTLFTFVDWESLVILPKQVAFKGDNGKYLSARLFQGNRYLQFAADDIGDPTVGNEIFNAGDGHVRVKSNFTDKFWSRNASNWILAESDDDTTSNNINTLFWPVRVDQANVVSLRSPFNYCFCRRLTLIGVTDSLSAAVQTIVESARLGVEELVLSRSIYDVTFRLLDTRIYGENILTMARGDGVNRTQEPNTVEVKLSYEETTTRTWNWNVSVKVGVSTTIRAGIPFIADGEIKISSEVSGSHDWGGTEETTQKVETTYSVIVPPMTRVRVNLLATKGFCDVPFSYVQRDALIAGQTKIYNMDDGVFTGSNCYNFTYESEQENL